MDFGVPWLFPPPTQLPPHTHPHTNITHPLHTNTNTKVWAPDLLSRGIPTTPGCDPLAMLTSDGHTAQMVREGLPGKRVWNLS